MTTELRTPIHPRLLHVVYTSDDMSEAEIERALDEVWDAIELEARPERGRVAAWPTGRLQEIEGF